MNYSKKIIFLAFLIAQMQRSSGVISLDLTSEGAKVIAPAIKDAALKVGSDAAKTLAPALIEFADAIKKLEPAMINGGVEAAKLLAPAMENSAEKLAVATVLVTAAIKKASLNVGLGTIKVVCIGAKGAVVAAAPWVAGGVAVGVLAYGGYRFYIYYYRTPEEEAKLKADQISALENVRLQIAKSQNATNALKVAEEKSQKETALKAALIQNASSKERTSSGLPVACQKAAHDYAIVAGQKKADKVVAAHIKYGPQSQAAMAARA